MNARTHDALPGRITARTPHPAEHQTAYMAIDLIATAGGD